jgi:hypothetical protein
MQPPQGWLDVKKSRNLPFNRDNRKNQRISRRHGFVDSGNSGAHGLFKIGGSRYQQQIPNSGLWQKERPVDSQQGFHAQVLSSPSQAHMKPTDLPL